MTKFSAVECSKGYWEIWEHIEGCKRQVCVMSANDILALFNETVPRVVNEPFLVGNPNCKHAWRPWKFNNNFIQCNNCAAMQKVVRLVPKEYKHGPEENLQWE